MVKLAPFELIINSGSLTGADVSKIFICQHDSREKHQPPKTQATTHLVNCHIRPHQFVILFALLLFLLSCSNDDYS